MSSAVLFSAIFISLFIGYAIADFQGSKRLLRLWRKFRSKYFKQVLRIEDTQYYGVLTQLLNEQPDEALDQFISRMEVNAESLEMHLALGSLLRRRGEFDRAVRLHQNLLTRPGLPAQKIHHVQLELACDYWRSGLLDRAETLLKELTQVSDVNQATRRQASTYLVDIYQGLGEWLNAIDVADQLTEKKFAEEVDSWRRMQAQFCCELVEQALREKNDDVVSQKLRSALAYDPECVRAELLRSDVALARSDIASALIALNHVADSDLSFISEVVTRLEHCLDAEELLDRLHGFLSSQPTSFLLLCILKMHLDKGHHDEARKLINREIERIPSLAKEKSLVKLITEMQESFPQRLPTIIEYIESTLHYRCLHCGTVHEHMLWLCPSCHSWSTIRQVS